MNNSTPVSYDALLVVSFGGPEGPDDVMPFLDNVLRGRGVPEERKKEVAHHYYDFDGVSPINEQNRALIAALEEELQANGVDLPVYFGNRNWHPLLTDTMQQMKDDGVKSALAFMTSGYSCYSGCRQYREDVQRSRDVLGDGAPVVDKVRVFYNHPDWVEVNRLRVAEALDEIPIDQQSDTLILFTAHSLPQAMADSSRYVEQLEEACQLVADLLGDFHWRLVYQSRSGSPHQPWLEPDVCDVLESVSEEGVENVVISPIGFISDHMEVIYDLDTEARECCDRLGVNMVRAKTAGTHPLFVSMIRELIEERMGLRPERRAIGQYGPSHDVCPEMCCGSGRQPPTKS